MSKFWERVHAACEQLEQMSYYDLLGVSPEAGPVEIASRYYALVARLHPDRHARERDPARREALTKLFARVGDAYRVLTDPELRKAYDRALAEGEVTLTPESRSEHKAPPERDPATELARQLLEKGQSRLDVGDTRGARSHLELAARYEPNSQAIATALSRARGGAGGPTTDEAGAGSPVAPAPEGEGAQASGGVGGPSSGAGAETPPAAGSADSSVSGSGTLSEASAAPPAAPAPGARPGPGGQARAADTLPPRPPVGGEEPGPPPAAPVARAHPRYEADVRIKLKLPTWDRFETFRTEDLSRGGMFVRAVQPLAKGTVVKLALSTPQGRAVEVRAQVVRTVGEGESAGMGLRFLEAPEDTRRQVDEILAAEVGGEAVPPASAPEPGPSEDEADRAGLALRDVAPPEPRLHVRERMPAVPVMDEGLFADALAAAAPETDDSHSAPGEVEAREGRNFLAAGDPHRAAERFEAAVTANPDDARAHAALFVARAQIAERAGRRDDARAQYHHALSYDPQCAEAIAALRGG